MTNDDLHPFLSVRFRSDARAYALARGGHVWIWGKPFGRSWLRMDADTAPPAEVEFSDEAEIDGVTVHTAPEMAMYASRHPAAIARNRWPRKRLSVTNPWYLG